MQSLNHAVKPKILQKYLNLGDWRQIKKYRLHHYLKKNIIEKEYFFSS
jgi:hypothetical protein